MVTAFIQCCPTSSSICLSFEGSSFDWLLEVAELIPDCTFVTNTQLAHRWFYVFPFSVQLTVLFQLQSFIVPWLYLRTMNWCNQGLLLDLPPVSMSDPAHMHFPFITIGNKIKHSSKLFFQSIGKNNCQMQQLTQEIKQSTQVTVFFF